ncbi:MAG: hypothetical protein K6G30_00670 [Acetatifactor sp.]|nr:hypothetical protein [Acetatifactor sp.]
MYYHASQTENIKVLEPRISNHGIPLIYLSAKRENVLVYLSNAVEKYCKETGFQHSGIWQKWGPYGFEADGRLRLEEYYPGATRDTYQGVSGYIYTADYVEDSGAEIQIPDAITSNRPVLVAGCEFVPDAYAEIIRAEQDGLLTILRYEELSEKRKQWIEITIQQEYNQSAAYPEYRYFLEGKFEFLRK